MRGLIYLLVVQQPVLLRHVQSHYDAGGAKRRAFHILQRILADISNDVGLADIYLLLDSLDECDNLIEFVQYITKNHLSGKAKWLLTGCNLSIIKKHLDPAGYQIILDPSFDPGVIKPLADYKVGGLVNRQPDASCGQGSLLSTSRKPG
jgi:hypothetical protein